MDEATARLVVLIVSGAGLFVWAWGLRYLQTAYRACRREAQLAAEQLDPTQPPPKNCVVGSAEVEGEPAELAPRAGSLLAMQNAPPIGQLKLLRCTDQDVAFEGAASGGDGTQGGRLIRRGQLQFTLSSPGRTRIDYAVELAGGQALLWWGVGAVVAGAVALVGAFAVMWLFVVPSADPSVRAQRRPIRPWPGVADLSGGAFPLAAILVRQSLSPAL